jgi:hypothetical protein
MTQELEVKVAAMEKELTRLKDIEAIRKLEHAYSFYLIMWMPDEIMDLFTDRDDTTLEWPEGTFFGRDGLRRFFGNINPKRDPEFMHQMMHLSDVIDIAEDGKTGKGRWWGFGAMALPAGDTGVMQALACGIYENDFIKEDGIWKLWKIKWVPVYSGTPATGWVRPEKVAKPRLQAEREEGEVVLPDWWQSDLPSKNIPYSYPSGYILPFHYNHPVTGKKTSERERNKRVKNVKDE